MNAKSLPFPIVIVFAAVFMGSKIPEVTTTVGTIFSWIICLAVSTFGIIVAYFAGCEDTRKITGLSMLLNWFKKNFPDRNGVLSTITEITIKDGVVLNASHTNSTNVRLWPKEKVTDCTCGAQRKCTC